MKRAVLIVGGVTAYSVLEAVLLLAYLLPETGWPPGLWQSILALTQFFTIPAIAVAFSLVLYGRHRWKYRVALYVFAVPCFFTVLLLLPSLPVNLAVWVYDLVGADPGDTLLIRSAPYWYPIYALLVASTLMLLAIKRGSKHVVALESSIWLADRQARIASGDRKLGDRATSWALWIPSLVVFIVFLFLPEMWGLLTHIQRPRAGELIGYRVTIPATWTILFRNTDMTDGSAWAIGVAGTGIGRGLWAHLQPGFLPLASWNIGTRRYPDRHPGMVARNPNKFRVIDQRDFGIGRTNLRCLEYVYAEIANEHVVNLRTVHIECSATEGLYAEFDGDKFHVPFFYRTLASAEEVK